MIHAYDECYLEFARDSFGTMLDVAVNLCKQDLRAFYDSFLASDYSLRFAKGDLSVIAGCSGIDLTYGVLGIVDKRKEIEQPVNHSPEYWTGWVLAHYQWYSGLYFQVLDKEVPVETIMDMYSTYCGQDISRVVQKMNELRQANRCMTYLKMFRQNMHMTQKELADKTEIPLKTIQQYEQGQKNINKAQSEYVIRLAKVLCCAPEQLLEF
ncbi:MAG: helix-turn-helix transcriptional regulator [Lachnospiraceae bacterium]|nr:helix-turn-helix transcriptional regulator [Lachnospiraceae bacterium]